MVILRLCTAVVCAAADRWPHPEERRREWTAELHELARRGGKWRMLRFAGSLVLSRPESEAVRVRSRAFWADPPMWLMAPAFSLLISGVVSVVHRPSVALALTVALAAAALLGGALWGRSGPRRSLTSALLASGVLPMMVVCGPIVAIVAASDRDAMLVLPWLLIWAGYAAGSTVAALRAPIRKDV